MVLSSYATHNIPTSSKTKDTIPSSSGKGNTQMAPWQPTPYLLSEIGLESVGVLHQTEPPRDELPRVELYRVEGKSTSVVAKIYKAGFKMCERGYYWPEEVDILRSHVPEHPCIIKFINAHGNVPSLRDYTLILEFCNSGTVQSLADYGRDIGRRVAEPLIWHIYVQLVKALEHCHKHDVAHGDPHSGNWLLHFLHDVSEGYPEVKLADFDLASHAYVDKSRGQKDISHVVYNLHPMLFPANKEERPWSKELIEWIGTPRIPRGLLDVPTMAELKRDMFPIAERKIHKAYPFRLPRWMRSYFEVLQEMQQAGKCYRLDLSKEVVPEVESSVTSSVSNIE